MTEHLGYEKHDPAGRGSGNSRNGTSSKTLLAEIGGIDLDEPRDRAGSFSPHIVRKGQTRLDGLNERIIALYARGMSTREIRAHLREMYDVDVSPDLISRVTDAVVESCRIGRAGRWNLPRLPGGVRGCADGEERSDAPSSGYSSGAWGASVIGVRQAVESRTWNWRPLMSSGTMRT